jgi:DUF1680 family protein
MKILEADCITVKGELERRLRLSARRLIEIKDENLIWSTHARYGADFPGRWLETMTLLSNMGLVEDDSPITQVANELLEVQCPEGCFAPSADYFLSPFEDKLNKNNDKGMDVVAPCAHTMGFCESRGHMGMLSFYQKTGDKRYLDSVRRSADFALEAIDVCRFPDATTDESENNIRSFLAAIIEGIVDVSSVTHETKYLALAEELAEYLPPVDLEVGYQHAHGYMTALRGVLKLYELTGNTQWLEFAKEQWDTIFNEHMLVTGGILETFPNVFGADESCQCSDWIRLSLQLWRISGEVKYMEAAELALLNHFYFQQWLNGGFQYGAQLERGVRWFEMVFCCSMSGPRGLLDVAENIITHNEDTVSVNFLFDIQAKVPLVQGPVEIDINSDFPRRGNVKIKLALPVQMTFALALRIPVGCDNPKLVINGQPVAGSFENGYLRCKRQWETGDAVELTFEMPIRFVPCKHKDNASLICRGPVIMAMRRQVQPTIYKQVEESFPSTFVYDSMKPRTSLVINGKEYKNSLGTKHGYCQIMFNVPDGVDGLSGKYFMSAGEETTEDLGQFHVYADGQEIFGSGPMTGKDPVGEFNISLEGAKTVLLVANGSDFYKALNICLMEVQLLPGGTWLTDMDLVNTASIPIDAKSLKEADDLMQLSFAEPVDDNWNIQLEADAVFHGQNKIPVVLVPMAQVCYDEIPEKYIYEGFYRHVRDYNCQLSQYNIYFASQVDLYRQESNRNVP